MRKRLTPEEKERVEKFYSENKSYKEISEITGLNPNTVYYYRHDVRERAKERRQRPEIKERKMVLEKILKSQEKQDLNERELKIIKSYLSIISVLYNIPYGKKFKQIWSYTHEEELRSKLRELKEFEMIEYREKRYWLTEEGENFYQRYGRV